MARLQPRESGTPRAATKNKKTDGLTAKVSSKAKAALETSSAMLVVEKWKFTNLANRQLAVLRGRGISELEIFTVRSGAVEAPFSLSRWPGKDGDVLSLVGRLELGWGLLCRANSAPCARDEVAEELGRAATILTVAKALVEAEGFDVRFRVGHGADCLEVTMDLGDAESYVGKRSYEAQLRWEASLGRVGIVFPQDKNSKARPAGLYFVE